MTTPDQISQAIRIATIAAARHCRRNRIPIQSYQIPPAILEQIAAKSLTLINPIDSTTTSQLNDYIQSTYPSIVQLFQTVLHNL